jgi:signal transduction histidine kinase
MRLCMNESLACIKVVDSGESISTENQVRILDIFLQAD